MGVRGGRVQSVAKKNDKLLEPEVEKRNGFEKTTKTE